MDQLLWVVVPYICLTTFVVGHLWRYRYDKFGWTTRSSQLYENRLLRIGSPLFHFGMLGVIGGHVIGLMIPSSWTDAVGMSEHMYHVVAVSGGLVSGVMVTVGLVILIYRRRTVGPVFSATTVMDKVMYAVLAAVILLGMWNTLASSTFQLGGHEYDYREGVSVWFRGIWALDPDSAVMAAAPLGFQAARPAGLPALRTVAVHPAGARLQRTGRLPDPAVHRVPKSRRPAAGESLATTWVGAQRAEVIRVYLRNVFGGLWTTHFGGRDCRRALLGFFHACDGAVRGLVGE